MSSPFHSQKSSAAHRDWYPALCDALKKTEEAHRIAGVFQLATYDQTSKSPVCPTPRVRSFVHRSFLTSSTYPAVPLLLSTTDIRSPKVSQLASPFPGANHVEIVFWTEVTLEQFRLAGRLYLVPSPFYIPPAHFPAPPPPGQSLLFDSLRKDGVDFEKIRIDTFDSIGGDLRASFCKPMPGTPMKSYDEALKWPRTLPKHDEAKTDEEKANLKVALENFALVLIEPLEVDYIEMGTTPERRTVYTRKPEETTFGETIVVP